MMQSFVAYNAAGRIRRVGIVQAEDLEKQSAPGLTFLAADDTATQETHYVLSGTVVERPTCPVSAAVSGLTVTLSNVPLSAAIVLSGDASYSAQSDDPTGTFALTLPDPGRYRVTVDCFPARDFAQDFTL